MFARRSVAKTLMAGTLMLGTLMASSLLTTPAAAQPSEENAAIALQLFNSGMAQLAAGEVNAACDAFGESMRLSPGNGTRYQLANCYERQGKIATAWGLFQRVLVESRRARNELRVASVRARLAALGPRVPKLRIDVADSSPDLEVFRNGNALRQPQWNTEVPVDPRWYVIEARAPGKLPWMTTVAVAPATRVRIEIPSLEAAPVAVKRPQPQPTPPDDGLGGMRIAGITLGGVGLVSFAGAIGASVSSINKNTDFDAVCPDPKDCNAEGLALNDEAKHAADAATALTVIGGAAAVTAIVLWVAAPDPRDTGVIVLPHVGDSHLGASALLRW